MSISTADSKIPVCFTCGEFIPINSLKKEYCSIECRKKGTKIKSEQRRRELVEINKELGRCVYCGKDIDNMKFFSCSKCREKQRKYSKNKHLNS